jgi:predicted transcriptional regulator
VLDDDESARSFSTSLVRLELAAVVVAVSVEDSVVVALTMTTVVADVAAALGKLLVLLEPLELFKLSIEMFKLLYFSS